MKKRIAIVLLAVMTMSMVACGKGDADANAGVSTEVGVEENSGVEIADSLELLNTVWGNYDEADKFPVGGGDSANLNFEGPAAFDATNSGELDVTLGFPAAHVDKIDNAASMMNAMMANNFTAGVYRVTDAGNVQVVADALKENIMARQWMCGMPEKMVVISVDNYVISAFGLSGAIDTFKTEIQEAYGVATVLYEESIS